LTWKRQEKGKLALPAKSKPNPTRYTTAMSHTLARNPILPLIKEALFAEYYYLYSSLDVLSSSTVPSKQLI
jgi:hypothetical protein